MPNWCDTTYECVFQDKSEYQALKKILDNNLRKRKTSRVQNGFGKCWLGNVIDALGYDWENYRCRGEIRYYECYPKENRISIYQDTAWCEQEGFRYALEQKYPSLNVYYSDEEPGCGLYVTNSYEYFSRYLLDNYEEPLYFDTLKEATECVSGIVGYVVEEDVSAIISALDDYQQKHYEEDKFYYNFNEFQLVD